MAGPTPPTFRSEFAGAAELDGGDFMTGHEVPRNETSGNQRIAMPAGHERVRSVNFDSRRFPVRERGDRGLTVGEVQGGDGDASRRGGVPEIRVQGSMPDVGLRGEDVDVDVEGEGGLQIPGRERRHGHGHGHRHGHGHGYAGRKTDDGLGAREHRKKKKLGARAWVYMDT